MVPLAAQSPSWRNEAGKAGEGGASHSQQVKGLTFVAASRPGLEVGTIDCNARYDERILLETWQS